MQLKAKKVLMNERPHCDCGRLSAVNYKKNGRTYYRKKCGKCITDSKKPRLAAWEIIGYIKKSQCEKCGFKSRYADQIHVVPVLGIIHQFKSVCLNCEVTIKQEGGWKGGDLTPDF